MVETHGLVAAIEAADAMVKSAAVHLVRQQRTNPAMVTHFVVGDVGAVRAAVAAAEAAAARVGRVAGAHIIPRPAPGVWKALVGVEPGEPAGPRRRAAQPAQAAASEDYGAMTVRELRKLARARDDDRLSGRDIASAAKADLVAFLRETE